MLRRDALAVTASASGAEGPIEAEADGHVALVVRAQAGDHAAFTRLIERRLDGSFRTARAILGNEADARDATQEAFLSA